MREVRFRLKTVNDVKYLDTVEVLTELGITKQHFHASVKQKLTVHRFDGMKKPYYRLEDILRLKKGKRMTVEGSQFLIVPAITRFWADALPGGHTITLGDRENGEAQIVPCPQEIATFANWGIGSDVVVRRRMHRIDDIPVSVHENYYPLPVANGLLDDLKKDPKSITMRILKEKKGIIQDHATDRLGIRECTDEEAMLLGIPQKSQVFVLRRLTFDQNSSIISAQRQTLIPRVFDFEYSYPCKHWNA